MTRNKYIWIIASSFLLGIVGLILDFIYKIEEESVLEGRSSSYYDFARPFWDTLIRPIQNYWYQFWIKGVMTSSDGVIIAFSFWLIFGFFVCIFIAFILSKFRNRAE